MNTLISFIGRHINSILNAVASLAWGVLAIDKLSKGHVIYGSIMIAICFCSLYITRKYWVSEKG